MAQYAQTVLVFLAALSAARAQTTVVGALSSMPALPVREHSSPVGTPNFTIVERNGTPVASQRRLSSICGAGASRFPRFCSTRADQASEHKRLQCSNNDVRDGLQLGNPPVVVCPPCTRPSDKPLNFLSLCIPSLSGC
jgi:hypothetical protein